MPSWVGGLILVVIVVAYFLFMKRPAKGIQNMSSAELVETLKDKSNPVSIIDVREPFEFSSGHIARAKNIPLGQVSGKLKDIPKDAQIVFVCRSGNRSMQAAWVAQRQGYTAVFNLVGGMSRWTGPVKK